MAIPRPEYPRPQFVRDTWLNLNGVWTIEFDPGKSGEERKLHESHGFAQKITVPFCPESRLSGVMHTDFIERMYYHRTLTVPKAWSGRRVLLHFGAVDYDCKVFIDGKFAGRHVGSSDAFCFDITVLTKPGKRHHLVVEVADELRSCLQPGGKQSMGYDSFGCSYTRTTGIWQTVWLEATSNRAFSYVQIRPDLDGGQFFFLPEYHAAETTDKATITIYDSDGKKVMGQTTGAAADGVPIAVKLKKAISWEPGNPYLYQLKYELRDAGGALLDEVRSYAGLRKVSVVGDQFLLNNKPIFQRLVLDQGFYPDGIWTAPSDDALRQDIEISMAAGFNGARLHQKVFEPRFHYWADKLGYLTWAESPSWGMGCCVPHINTPEQVWHSFANFTAEWTNLMRQDFNSPSVIAWTPLNETGAIEGESIHVLRLLQERVYDLTKALDPTRPCNETSGFVHAKTDLWTVHAYCRSAEELRDTLVPTGDKPATAYCSEFSREKLRADQPVMMRMLETGYHGQPYIPDEIGGFKYLPPKEKDFSKRSWGYYGMNLCDAKEWLRLMDEQIRMLESLPQVAGFCYTQLTDVEQEQNGVYCYDRSLKVPVEELAKAFGHGKLTR